MSNQSCQTAGNNDYNGYSVKIDTFEGPLDLLLHLIKTNEIDIYDIPIAEITHQYLEYLSFLIELNLENISEFVEMASILILIKSKAMLPSEIEFDEEGEDLREELISKLLEYQKYKMAAGLLETKIEEGIPFINKSTDPVLFNINETESNWKQLSVLDLIGAFAQVLNKKEDKDGSLEVIMYNFTVEEKVEMIMGILEEKDDFNYFDIINLDMPKLELVCTFLALLEMVKKGAIAIRQHKIFGDIHIFKKNEIPQQNE